jgi:hypothetical protein
MYLNYLGRCFESCALLVCVAGGLVVGPLVVVVVGFGLPLIFLVNLRINIIYISNWIGSIRIISRY